MKNMIRKLCLGIGLLCLFLLGCTKEKVVIRSEGNLNLAGEVSREEEDLSGVSKEKSASGQGDASKEDMDSGKNPDVSEERKAGLWIHICGEVVNPGVYELPAGARIWDALQAAGGATGEGEADYLNQAGLLEDGMKITVPSHMQVKQWETSGETGIQGSQASTPAQSGTSGQGSGEAAKVNLNTADETLLCTLPGIGASRARSIIAYREENGPFSRIEDIMKVTGIKEAAFAKIKDYISVS